MTTIAPSGDPAPPQEDESNGSHAHYVPHDVEYNAEFEDSLIQTILHPPENPDTGIRVIPEDSNEAPVEGVSVRAQDITPESLPTLTESDLPLPLNDPRRKFASPIPGIKLTHPNGYLEGGPGLNPEMDTFPDDFFSNNPNIRTPAQLRRAIQRDIKANMETLRERMRARQEAKEKNERLAKEVRTLTDQHEMEQKIQERMLEEQRKRKEAREKRRGEKDSAG